MVQSASGPSAAPNDAMVAAEQAYPPLPWPAVEELAQRLPAAQQPEPALQAGGGAEGAVGRRRCGSLAGTLAGRLSQAGSLQ